VIVTDNLFGDILSDLAARHRYRLRREPQSEPRAHRRLTLRTGPRRGARHRRHRYGNPLPPCRRPFSCSSTWKKWTPHGVLLKRWQTLMVRSLRSARTASTKNLIEGCKCHNAHEEDLVTCAVDWENATTHVLSHTLHYGMGAFEAFAPTRRLRGRGDFPLARAHGTATAQLQILMIDVPTPSINYVTPPSKPCA